MRELGNPSRKILESSLKVGYGAKEAVVAG